MKLASNKYRRAGGLEHTNMVVVDERVPVAPNRPEWVLRRVPIGRMPVDRHG